MDNYGNLIVADVDNDETRVVATKTGTFYGQAMTAGHIYKLVGGADPGSFTPATSDAPPQPHGLTVDSAGNLAFADTEANDWVWVVAAQTGTFYGQAMTAGDIYVVAGTGTFGFSGDGGPATSADVDFPQDVAATAAGNLLIADSANNRVREVQG